MKESEEKIHVLQLKELKRPIWQEKMQRSVEQARKEENGEECADAQQTLINLIMCLGGIREDVFEYLMTPRFANVESVKAIGSLLCYAAPVEWMELSVRALERTAGAMYVNEITESYQAGLSIEQVESFLEESETVFEMCQNRVHVINKKLGDKMTGGETGKPADKVTGSETGKPADNVIEKREEKLRDRMTGREEKLADNVTGSGRTIAGDGISYDHLAQMITAAVMDAMQKSGQMMNTDDRENFREGMTGDGREELGDRMTGSGKEKLGDRMTGSEKEKLADNVTGSKKSKPADRMTGSEGEKAEEKELEQESVEEKYSPEKIPDFPDGEELQDNRILTKELTEAEEQAGKRISFFQILLSRHMKKAFAKMDAETQVSKIFEIMVEKKYGKEKILPIRRLMNGGMSNEFIFSLLEKDFSEEELNELCETLLAEDIAPTSMKKEISEKHLSEENEESTERWEEEA